MIASLIAYFVTILVGVIYLHGYGLAESSNPRQTFQLHRVMSYGDQEKVFVSGRHKVSLFYKLNPIWWFLNDEDPVPPDWYAPEWPTPLRIIAWYIRNPLHNMGSYVVGVEDRNYTAYGHAPLEWVFWSDIGDRTGFKFTKLVLKSITLPGFTYDNRYVQIACGWRLHGRFALKLRLK